MFRLLIPFSIGFILLFSAGGALIGLTGSILRNPLEQLGDYWFYIRIGAGLIMLYLGLNSARWESGALEYIVDDLSLAERWEFSSDSTSLTYYLRSEAVWSDGQPVRAADVVSGGVFNAEIVEGRDRVDEVDRDLATI